MDGRASLSRQATRARSRAPSRAWPGNRSSVSALPVGDGRWSSGTSSSHAAPLACTASSSARMPEGPGRPRAGAIAYLLTGFPRLSETFIASEIHWLECQGLRLRLFVLKRDEDHPPHPVVERIVARPDYLPRTASLSRTPFLPWLAVSLPPFLPAIARTAAWRPLGLGRAVLETLAQAVRAWRAGSWPPRVVKEFLQATALADRLRALPDVRHLHAHFCHGTTTVAWLTSTITGVPFSFTAHARDLYQDALNPAGLLARKVHAARFAVTCTEASRVHLARIGDGVPVHCVYHGLNADLARLLVGSPVHPATPGT